MDEFITIKEASQLCNANDATIWKWAMLDKWLNHLYNPHKKPAVLVDLNQIRKLGKIHWVAESAKEISKEYPITRTTFYNWNRSNFNGFKLRRIPYEKGEQYLDDELFELAKKLASEKEMRAEKIRQENHIKCMIKIKEKARIRQELKEHLKQQKIQLKEQMIQEKLERKQSKLQRKKLIESIKQSAKDLIQSKKICKKIRESKKNLQKNLKQEMNQIEKNINEFKNCINPKPIKPNVVKEYIPNHHTIAEYLDFLLNGKSEELQKIYNNDDEISFLERKINKLIKITESIQVHNLKYLLSYLKNKDYECDNKIRMCHLSKFLSNEKHNESLSQLEN